MSAEDFKTLLKALEQAEPTASVSLFSKQVAKNAPAISASTIKPIVNELFAMNKTIENWNFSAKDFAKSVSDAAFSQLSEEFQIGEADRDILKDRQALAANWKRDTGFRSSLSDKFTHPAYQRIMAMGKPALPLILRDLRDSSDHWFYALEFITGNEGKKVAFGADTIEAARDAWLNWGRERGCL